ncbi:MAG TPA: putative zinc-binding metallopeptidase [Dermatophilaceae bacterium]|nr:putative zinc-binding metallopeptidase [Dermatophilaceae bacterium]
MRDFLCPRCNQRLAFENSACLACGTALGLSAELRSFTTLGTGGVVKCRNADLAGCNWVVTDQPRHGLCLSCRLTRTRPASSDQGAMPAFRAAEAAKRRLVFELLELRLPIRGRDVDPEAGLRFDLLSSSQRRVLTGHDSGLITLDLAEGDDVHREQLRIAMAEPYRTLLGHMRHEIGHYYYMVLVGDQPSPTKDRFTELFGDPDVSYQSALDRHYSRSAPPDWAERFVSSYATMHPAEDWAETFAHYLHIRDTVDTASEFGMAPAGVTLAGGSQLVGELGLDRLIEVWLPLSWALNMLNRSMGHSDLYPFVLPGPTLEKMRLVHNLVTGVPASPGVTPANA